MIPLFSTQIKSTIVLDLMALRAQFILTTCKLESLMNFLARLVFIGTITCFLEGPLVVMLILGLDLSFEPLMTFCISSIFLFERLENVFLIFNVSLAMFFEAEKLDCLDKDVA